MSRDFTKVAPTVWGSKKFSALTTCDAKLFYLYILTGPHQTNAGVSKVPLAYAAYDLKIDAGGIEKSMEACVNAGLLEHDPETDEILITNWFRFNIPMNAKHRKGVAHNIERIVSERLYEVAIHELEQVYFDPDASGPNSPLEQIPDGADRETGEVIDYPGTPNPPHRTSRGEFDKMIESKRMGA